MAFQAIAFEPSRYHNELIIVSLLFGFWVQGTTEEIVCRGFVMNKLRTTWGFWPAVLINAAIFTLIHAFNPGMGVFPVINLFLFGLVFSLVFAVTDNMWLTGAAHGMWNFAQGCIFGVLVSGNRVPESILETHYLSDKGLLNGRDFGLEGGLITTLVGVVVFILLVILYQKKTKSISKIGVRNDETDAIRTTKKPI